MADGLDAGHFSQRLARAHQQRAFVFAGEQRCVLVNPAVNADLVAGIADAAWLARVDEGGNGGDEECCRHVVPLENAEDAGNADTPAELAPGEPPDGTAAGAEFRGLMVAIKRQRDGTARAVFPRGGRKAGPARTRRSRPCQCSRGHWNGGAGFTTKPCR